jgi:hypothetical protein
VLLQQHKLLVFLDPNIDHGTFPPLGGFFSAIPEVILNY